MKLVLRFAAIIALLVVSLTVQGVPVVQVAQAEVTSVVQPPCDEAAFDIALAVVEERGGGAITFNCGSATRIDFTTAKTISIPVTIDGANQITLSGGNRTQLFIVDSGDSLTIRRLTLTLGFSPADGGAISNFGTLIMEDSTIENSNATGSGGASARRGL